MTPTPDNIAVKQLIRINAATPAGYRLADSKGLPGYMQSNNQTDRMVKRGELLRVKVQGHPLRFVNTQAQVDVLTAWLQAIPKKRIRKPGKPRAGTGKYFHPFGPLRQFVLQDAIRPEGTAKADAKHLIKTEASYSHCVLRLIASRHIFRSKVIGRSYRYFSSQADADAWQAVTPTIVPPAKPRPVKRKRVAVVKPVKVKVAKAKPVIAAPARSYAIVIRKPYSPPAPRADAIAVYNDQTRYISRPFVDLRAVVVVRQRIGTASWVTL